jgi:tripartite-type tricarboxylate transporter receptor subunit TctC
LSDLIADARRNPGKVSLAALAATPSHIGFTLLKRKANVDIIFVPFPGTAPIITALLGGHISAMTDNYGGMAEHVNAGKLRPLATLSPTRTAGLDHIPTVAESGYPEAEIETWFGLFAPANLKTETTSQLIDWVSAAMQVSEIRSKLEPLGQYPSRMCGAEFAGSLRKQYEFFGAVIRDANIQAP